ncbi:MAG TPA: SWIM zinc finger family protein, partial [Propionibacteriaceae bacterium]
MTVWEREQVLALAPDAGSVSAALEQTRPGRWSDLGARPSPGSGPSTGSGSGAVWGSCRGSGQTPYRTVVELNSPPAYSCTCPSRKIPCKHALALLLLWSAGQVGEAEAPAYAVEWLGKRAQRAAQQEGREARPPGELADPDAAVKRAAARAERVAGGLDELDQWLSDQLHGGLAGLERAGYSHFESIAARMIDAQAPGIAGLLRALPGEFAGEGWPARVLDQLAALHLLSRAHRQLDQLDVELAATVRSRVGYPVAKDDVLARPGITDDWVALGMVDTVEYRLETRRVWLYGAASQRWAMLLSFAPPGGALDSSVVPGGRVRGAMHFYPGSGQVRGLVGERSSTAGAPVYPHPATHAEVQQQFAALLAADPWASRMPAAISAAAVPPRRPDERWRLRDHDGVVSEVIG